MHFFTGFAIRMNMWCAKLINCLVFSYLCFGAHLCWCKETLHFCKLFFHRLTLTGIMTNFVNIMTNFVNKSDLYEKTIISFDGHNSSGFMCWQ